MPGMLFDVSEIDEVQQRTDRRVDEVVELPAFLVCKSPGLDKLRRAFEVLLKKHRRLDAARPPLKDGGPIFQVRHDVVRDLEIKAEQVKLRELLVGPVDAIEARDGNVFAADLHDEIAFRLFET